MPLYQFRCQHCGHEKELFRKISEFSHRGPSHCFDAMTLVIAAPRVMSDIEPYQAMGADIETGKCPMITSRSQHRDYLKRNGYVELGNELPKSTAIESRTDAMVSKADIARDVKRVMEQKGIRA